LTIETTDGVLVAERRDPAAAFAGTTRSSPWDEFQVACFTGEANWNYLVAPFLFARLPGKIEAQSRTAGRGSVTARSGDGTGQLEAECALIEVSAPVESPLAGSTGEFPQASVSASERPLQWPGQAS
jgi:hypothetical protein